MDAAMMSECAKRGWQRHGVSWSRLSFGQRHAILTEIEATMPPVKPPHPQTFERRADGSSIGIAGGVGDGGVGKSAAPKTPGLDKAAVEQMELAHRAAEGAGEYATRPGVGAGRFDHPVRRR
jgi:hypothetical protein